MSFRKDAVFANIVFKECTRKITTPTTVIISKKDYFTKDYKKAKPCWKIYAENVDEVKFIDSKSHYFQSDDAEALVEMIGL